MLIETPIKFFYSFLSFFFQIIGIELIIARMIQIVDQTFKLLYVPALAKPTKAPSENNIILAIIPPFFFAVSGSNHSNTTRKKH